MNTPKSLRIAVPGADTTVSARIVVPKKARWLTTLAHGAGAGMDHSWLVALSEALADQGIATLRFQFPYMEAGGKRTDKPAIAAETVACAVGAARKAVPKLPVFAAGKSFGSRMTTTAASEGRLPAILGVICFGFPLHPAKKPAVTRAAHLAAVSVPTLLLQGTRDDLADLTLLRPIVKQHRKWIELTEIEGADHGFAVRKSSGRTNGEVLDELALRSAQFCALHSG